MNLAKHPIWEATDPARCRLVRFSEPFPPWLNPFADDRVVIRAAAIPGDVPHSKFYMAREMLLGDIMKGAVKPDTTVVEATSGNTGHGLAFFCNALGLKARLIMADVPVDKINAIRVFGNNIETVQHSNSKESTVERARREGAEKGVHNPDQYASLLNVQAHRKYLARQLFKTACEMRFDISLIAVASGTMGTSLGLQEEATEEGLKTRILPIMCEEGEEVPGARTLKKVKRDIRLPWEKVFSPGDIEYGMRHESFLLSYLSWRCVPQLLGPSFGLALQGALNRLWLLRHTKRLGQFRNSKGIVEVVVLGADTYSAYINVMLGELKTEELTQLGPEPDLPVLLNMQR